MVDRYNIGLRNQHTTDGAYELYIHRLYITYDKYLSKMNPICTFSVTVQIN